MPEPTAPSGGTDLLEHTQETHATDTPWQVLLWNDPVNTTTYVTLTLQRLLEVTAETAEQLMLTAHVEGKTAVKSGTQGECKKVTLALMSAGLWATMQKADS